MCNYKCIGKNRETKITLSLIINSKHHNILIISGETPMPLGLEFGDLINKEL